MNNIKVKNMAEEESRNLELEQTKERMAVRLKSHEDEMEEVLSHQHKPYLQTEAAQPR